MAIRTTGAPQGGFIAAAGNYEPGDVVTIVTGGPDMTVHEVCECGNVLVDWFTFSEETGWTHWRDEFPAICLELAS